MVVGLLRLYMNDLLFYQESPDNPHGPIDLNGPLLDKLPPDGTLQDFGDAAISHGDAADIDAEGVATADGIATADSVATADGVGTADGAVTALTTGEERPTRPVGEIGAAEAWMAWMAHVKAQQPEWRPELMGCAQVRTRHSPQ